MRLAGFTDPWISNHISIVEEEHTHGVDVRFTFNYFSEPIAEILHQFSIADQIHIIEYIHIEFPHLDYFVAFPSLHTLHLRYYYFLPMPIGINSRRRLDRSISLPYAPQLQSLIIEEIYPEELVTLDFSKFPNLKSLDITINASLATVLHHMTFPKLELTKLTSLSLKYVGILEVSENLLSIQSLRTIRIKCTSVPSISQNILQQLSERTVNVIIESW